MLGALCTLAEADSTLNSVCWADKYAGRTKSSTMMASARRVI